MILFKKINILLTNIVMYALVDYNNMMMKRANYVNKGKEIIDVSYNEFLLDKLINIRNEIKRNTNKDIYLTNCEFLYKELIHYSTICSEPKYKSFYKCDYGEIK
jgi:hypothetical protein